MMLDAARAREAILAFFLTEFPSRGQSGYVATIAQQFLRATYSVEGVEEFWDAQGLLVEQYLVQERNWRLEAGLPVPYDYLDDDGRRITPVPTERPPTGVFQQALLRLTASEFERLACYLLSVVGCESYWATPASHDQGLDGFGCFSLPFIRDLSGEARRTAVWMVLQAKHYESGCVSTGDIRDLVGATHLSKYAAFSTKSERYKQLQLRPLSAIVIVLATSGKVSRAARILAQNSGVVLVSADEIREALTAYWKDSETPIASTEGELVAALRRAAESVPVTT